MNRALCSIVAVLSLAATATAQDYDRTVKQNHWNVSSNINGIRQDRTNDAAYAELYTGVENGGFKSYSESLTPWKAGAKTKALVHLDRFSMAGGFSFEQSQGDGMCGSMFIHPGLYPVDMLEFTPGKKTLQTYAFDGGLSVDLTPYVRLGGKIDFTSSNWSKRKDLRHTNYRLDMEVSPGIMFHEGTSAIGLNYIFKRDTETITAEQIGTGESTYYVFHDKGLMYGAYGPWGSSGIHLDEVGVSGFPVARNFHGAAMQFDADGSLFELTYLHGDGKIGEKQSTWYRFPSNSWKFCWSDKYKMGKVVYLSRLSHEYVSVQNNESVLEKVSSGGVSSMIEHGSNLIYKERSRITSLEDELLAEKWELMLAIYRKQTFTEAFQMYPYVSDMDLSQYSVVLAPKIRRKAWELGTSLSFTFGHYKSDEYQSTEDSGVVTAPYRLEEYFSMDMEYKTAKRLGAKIDLRVHLPKKIYLKLDASALKAFNVTTLGGDKRFAATIGLGYEF